MRGKLKPGRIFLTGNNTKVEIIETDRRDGFIRNLFPVVGLVDTKPFPTYDRFTVDGRWDICNHRYRLKKDQCWYNISIQRPAPT